MKEFEGKNNAAVKRKIKVFSPEWQQCISGWCGKAGKGNRTVGLSRTRQVLSCGCSPYFLPDGLTKVCFAGTAHVFIPLQANVF